MLLFASPTTGNLETKRGNKIANMDGLISVLVELGNF